MNTVFGRLNNSSLKRRMADEIRENILNGTLREGERLVERKLAEQFSTSLTAVREALIELEAQGFITKKPNFATFVTKFPPDAVDKIFAFRRVIEVHTVAEAARVGTSEQMESLSQAYEELLAAAEAQDTRLYLQKDLALHELIWQISNNEYFEIALKRVVRPFFAFTAIRMSHGDSYDLVEDASNHLAFVDPIRSRDAEAAGKAYLSALDEWYAQACAYVFT